MHDIITSTSHALERFYQVAIANKLEIKRASQAIYSILSIDNDQFMIPSMLNLRHLLEGQHLDGGWADPEETAWTLSVLEQLSEKESKPTRKGKKWLNDVRHPGGGWGRHPRDRARIITTGIVITLVPSVATNADREWVRQEWGKDMVSPVRLSYKGAFYLLTVYNNNSEHIDPLVQETIAYLIEDQNDDGGFGPWRNHPIGSDPWSTGVVLWGLSKWINHVSPEVVEKALAWLEKTQLPSGYWPYHYLDEGTSYALIGAVEASRALASRK